MGGCIAMSSCTSSDMGTITGRAMPCLGASGQAPVGATVDVSIISSGHVVRVLTVSSPYNFTVSVTPGPYDVASDGGSHAKVNVGSGYTVFVTLGNSCG